MGDVGRTASTVKQPLASSGPSAGSEPAAAPAPRIPPGEKLGRFVVRELLGEGGMGVVYAAHDSQLDRVVALKQVRLGSDPTTLRVRRQRLEAEARALARLSHPNVVTVYDVVAHRGELFVAMELVQGESLRRWASGADRSWREIVDVLVDVGHGLEAAHAAGLVHGDVKPDNVLVDVHGRAVVVDFGLARAAETFEDITADPHARPTSALTTSRGGVLMGTPAYLAPEAFDGHPTDALTDQFALCVTAFELLYDTRPFQGGSFEVLQSRIREGRIATPKSSRDVPAWIDRVVRRGLAVDRERRWRSIRELVDALQRDPMRRARIPLVVLGLAAVPALVAIGASDDPRPCAAGAELVLDAWSGEDRQQVRAAFEGSGAPFATKAADRTLDRLDAHAHAWIDAWHRVCVATHVDGEQPPELLDARMACLDEAKRGLAELRTAFVSADVDAIVHADRAIAMLRRPEACWDEPGATAPSLAPADAARAERAAELVTRAEAEIELHRFAAAQKAARAALHELAAVDHPRLRAAASLAHGRALRPIGSIADIRVALERARDEAEIAADDGLKLDALVEILAFESQMGLDAEAARRASAEAKATLQRLGDPADERGAYLHAEGRRQQEEGALEDALATLEEAATSLSAAGESTQAVRADIAYVKADLARFEEAEHEAQALLDEVEAEYGADHPATIPARDTLVMVYFRQLAGEKMKPLVAASSAIIRRVYGEEHRSMGDQHARMAMIAYAAGDHATAIEESKAAIRILERDLGEDHPRVANSVRNLGTLYLELGRFDEARVAFARALRSHRAAYADDHPIVATSLAGVAAASWSQGDFEGATAMLEEALAIQERVLGPLHPDVGTTLHQLGITVDEIGRIDDAVAYLERAREVFVRVYGEAHISVARTDLNLGNLALRQRRFEDAGQACARALEVEPDVSAMLCLAEVELEARRWEAARAHLDRAAAIAGDEPEPPTHGAAIAFGRARLALADGQRARARSLAASALATYREAGPGRARTVADIEAWLAAHP